MRFSIGLVSTLLEILDESLYVEHPVEEEIYVSTLLEILGR